MTSDSVAWCAAFLGATLERSGVASTRSLLARSYLHWGDALESPRLGAIAVLSRGADPGAGHVGYWIGETAEHLILLGGNQSDAVRVSAFPRSSLLGYRWPSVTAAPELVGDIFETALAHVLEMEGGWTDDPYDPGGPTNLGITLAVYAAHSRRPLDDAMKPALLAELRALTPRRARDIYIARYWTPAHCAALPAGLAVMHFDAAVNHGVGNAVRFLQSALDVDVDGEIGPETLAAVRAIAQSRSLDNYAELRRVRYRALPHFWRFGRGWLRRVDETLALARRQFAAQQPSQNPPPKPANPKEPSMTTFPASTDTMQPPKWWGHSMTIWGTLITALSTVLPILGPALGLDLTPEIIKQLGDNILMTIQAIGGLAGTLIAIFGRVRAAQPLVRRPISLSL